MKKFKKCLKKFVLYLCETYKNKLCALALLIAGWIPLKISGDGTALMILSFFAIGLFFARTDWFLNKD